MRTYDLSGDPAAVEAQQIEQRMRLAQLLAAKGMSDGPVYSNRAGLAKMLTGVLGNVQMRGAEKEQRALAERQQAAKRSEMDAILAATQGDAGYLPQGAPQVDDEGNAMPGAPKGPDRMKLAALLARSSNPNLQQAGLALAMKGPPEEESFSLKPGEKRFRGSRVVAEVPVEAKAEKPQRMEIGGSVIEFGPEGAKVVYKGDPKRDIRTVGRSVVEIGPDGRPQVLYTAPKEGGEEKAPAGYRWGGNGALEHIPGGPADPAVAQRKKEPTEGERVSSGYAKRMDASEKIMGPIEESAGKPGVREAMMAAVPGVGETVANALPSFMGGRSADRQSYRQAQEDWVRAKLRKESGAVIADEEMDREIRTYFPQIGDTPQVVKQKAAARKVAAEGMRTAAGELGGAPAPAGWAIKPLP